MGKSRITWVPTAGSGLLAALVCLIAACAAGPHAQVPAGGPLPAVVVTLGPAPEGFAAAAEAVSRSALAGSSVTFDAADGTAADVRIALRLTWRNLTEREYETIWRYTTLLFVTVYPSTCRHREYRLDADVTGAGGFARSYAAQDTTVAWLWLLQGSNCGDDPTAGEVESVSRLLLRDVYADMAREQALDSAVRGIMPPPSPRVQVSSNRADAIVEQVMRLDRNFGAWTLAATDAVPADYRLDLRFDVRQGEFSVPRALLGIGTGGIFGLCKSSTVRLVATIADRGARRTRAYVLEESFRSAMESTAATAKCERVDETTHPEVFAEVIRRLLERLAKDRAIDHAPPAAGAALPPLVRIVATGHEATILSEIARTAPLPRFLFTDADVAWRRTIAWSWTFSTWEAARKRNRATPATSPRAPCLVLRDAGGDACPWWPHSRRASPLRTAAR